ncbi:MAG: hypothetical protein HUK26_06435, partial [Duodenibacillus sp.]|nr:hypothetical protein [Duodenibacillus sp.]
EYDAEGNRTKGYVANAYNDTLFVWDYTFENGVMVSETRRAYRENVTVGESGDTIKSFVRSFESKYSYEYDETNMLQCLTEYNVGEIFSKTYYKS